MNNKLERYHLFIILGLMMMSNNTSFGQMASIVEISAGGGWSTMNYGVFSPLSTLDVKKEGSWSMIAHGEYIWMFSRYIGMGVGVDITHYGSSVAIDGQMQWNNVLDTDGEVYNHHLTISGWHDRQDIWYIHPGVFLHAQVPIYDHITITLAGGGRYGCPISQQMRYSGATCHTGNYPQWGLTLYEMDNHGFYTANTNIKTADWKPNKMIDILLRAGVEYQIGTYTALLMQGWVSYGFRNAFEIPSTDYDLGFANDREGMGQIHYFMNDYQSVLSTNLVKESHSRPIAAGLEIGVRWKFPHATKRKTPCRCIEYYR